MKKVGMKSRSAQQVFGMSFGVLFSIILIIVFIIAAWVIIKAFMGTGKCANIGMFIRDFEEHTDNVYKSAEALSPGADFESSLDSDIEFLCFVDMNSPGKGSHADKMDEMGVYGNNINLFFWPPGAACNIEGREIPHLDLSQLLEKSNPYCFKNSGKIKIPMERQIYDKAVKILVEK